MTITTRQLCTALLLLLLSLAGRGLAVVIPLVNDAAATLAQARQAGSCLAVDLSRGTEGILLQGETPALPAGRYRLHLPLALAPVGHLHTGALAITLRVDTTTRELTTLHFPAGDEFTDFPLDFTVRAGQRVPVSVRWSLASEQARKNRIKALDLPEMPDPDGGEPIIEMEDPFTVDEQGRMRVADLPKLQVHLAGYGAWLEPLSPVSVPAVTTDKITYRPGERGTGTVAIRNDGDMPATIMLAVEVVSGFERQRPLATETFTLPAGETKSWTGTFATDDLYWGAELRATATVAGKAEARSAVFAVRNNLWETAIVYPIAYTDSYSDPQVATRLVERARADYYTAFEAFFWAPCDFGDFTPDSELFYGGQTQYKGTISGTKNLIAFAKQHGMEATVYSDLWGGDGASGFEIMRQHPDWFGGAAFGADWLENWWLMEQQRIPEIHLWPLNWLEMEKDTTPALTLHAEEFIASHQQFGWAATRYDSYTSTEWTKRATKQVREYVAKQLPEYRWGYNTNIPLDERIGASDIMLSGGQLAMEEALRDMAKNSGSITGYARTLNAYRDIVWKHDGHLGICYDEPLAGRGGVALDNLYFSSLVLASGAHPYYGRMESVLGQYPRCALRYSEYLYDNKLLSLPNPETVISFGGKADLLDWQKFARTRNLGGGRQRIVLHLIRPPVEDASLRNAAQALAFPLRKLPVTFQLPAGATVEGAWLLGAMPAAGHERLATKAQGGKVTVVVPEVRLWNALVLDYRVQEGGR